MKYRYRLHPIDYDLGENEKFYSDMEGKGWRVAKRGIYLSKFSRVEPGRARYRIEIVPPGFEEDGCTMPPEQRAVYEDCGWEYVSGRSLFHLFRAPEDSDAPEFYADPAEQLPTIEALRKQNWWGWLPITFMIVWRTFLIQYRTPGIKGALYSSYMRWVEQPGVVGIYLLFWLWVLYLELRQNWYIRRTCRSLRQGIPLEHNPQERHRTHKIIRSTILALAVLCSVLIAVQAAGKTEQPLPEQANGPYLLISDLGREREEDYSHPIRQSATLLANRWEVWDAADNQDGDWMRQVVYQLHSPAAAWRLAAALRETSLYFRSGECYTYSIGNLDAWICSHELVAVRGSMAARIYYGNVQDPEDLLAVLEERWTAYDGTEEGVK